MFELDGPCRVEGWIKNKGLNWRLHKLNSRVKTVAEAAYALSVDEGSIVKTVVIKCGDLFYACILRGDTRLDLNKISIILHCKPRLAKPREVEEVTGYSIGGVPPAPLPSSVGILVDIRAAELKQAYGGGGDDYTLLEFRPKELLDETNAVIVDMAANYVE
ncbi:MAG: hypothetical protein F7B60_01715 [Desulfurococcales archaeon]|nr:hypothetical protein [Desulfurococcales archaeon]